MVAGSSFQAILKLENSIRRTSHRLSSSITAEGATSYNRVFAATGLRPFAQMAFVTAVARAPAAPTGPEGPDGHLANTTNVIRKAVELTKDEYIVKDLHYYIGISLDSVVYRDN